MRISFGIVIQGSGPSEIYETLLQRHSRHLLGPLHQQFIRRRLLSCLSSCWVPVAPPSSDGRSGVSMILLCPTQIPPGSVSQAHRLAVVRLQSASHSFSHVKSKHDKRWSWVGHAFFLNCLWMASSASLMVTPFRFLAVTSRPNGKCRSIFLTGGVVRCFFNVSFSSKVAGEVLSFLHIASQLSSFITSDWTNRLVTCGEGLDSRSTAKALYNSLGKVYLPVQLLGLLGNLKLLALFLYFCVSM